MGATWVAITPFGRVADLGGTGVDLTFEAPFDRNRVDVARAMRMAHARGLRVMLVPHLWVESGEWRALIDPKTDDGWRAGRRATQQFVLAWAAVAEATGAEMFSVGVELRSWVTTPRAPSFAQHHRRRSQRRTTALLTYSANWDDVDRTAILGEPRRHRHQRLLPALGQAGAPEASCSKAAATFAARSTRSPRPGSKPVLFTEIGYTTRPDPGRAPLGVARRDEPRAVDETAQAAAYRALLAPLLDEPDFAGFFVWRVYADPDDTSQEAPWGFSPRGKLAELVVRDAFAARWACDPWWRAGWGAAALTPGIYP